MSSQDFSSEGFASDNSGDFSDGENEDFTDNSSPEMSEDDDDDDFFAQLARNEEEGFETPGVFTQVPVQQPELTQLPFTPQASTQQPKFTTAPQAFTQQPKLTPVTFSQQPKFTTAPQAFAQQSRLTPTTTLRTPQTLAQQPRLTPITSQSAPPRLNPILQFPKILASSGTPIQQIFAPPKLVVTKMVKDIIEQDPLEEKQRWEYRDKYTKRAEIILRNISKYYTEQQMFSAFGISINQIHMISHMNAEQIVSIGQAKTNNLYERVTYPAEIERTIKILDTIKIS